MIDIILVVIIVLGWGATIVWAYWNNGGIKDFKKSFIREKKQKFAVIFCVEYDYATKFYTYQIFDNYEKADHCIRMAWGKSIQEHRENGYKVDSAWIMIQPL